MTRVPLTRRVTLGQLDRLLPHLVDVGFVRLERGLLLRVALLYDVSVFVERIATVILSSRTTPRLPDRVDTVAPNASFSPG
jgi:hypothetical protein